MERTRSLRDADNRGHDEDDGNEWASLTCDFILL